MENKGRRLVEAGKSLLIVLLSVSALWLIVGSGLFNRQFDTVLERARYDVQPAAQIRLDIQPQCMAVVNREGCCGVQYDQQQLTGLFDRFAPLLGEALSGTDAPESITQGEWERALTEAPAVYFDFGGGIPLSTLSGWLSGGENDALSAVARRLLLGQREGKAALYYQDAHSLQYYVCRAQVTDLSHLSGAVNAIAPNGAQFACQSPDYAMLAADTLISPQTPTPEDFTAADPLSQEREQRLADLLEALSFPTGITAVYDTPQGWRARSGNDMLTITAGSEVTYRSTREEGRYPVAGAEEESELTRAVNAARRLVLDALEDRMGQAQLYLLDVRRQSAGCWQVEFAYSLDGIPVRSGRDGRAATVLVDQGYITQFDLYLRSYTATEQTRMLLPQAQAAAIAALEGEGKYLKLCYRDGGDQARAGWVAE